MSGSVLWIAVGEGRWLSFGILVSTDCWSILVFVLFKPPCQSDTACLQTALIQRLWFTWYLKPATFFLSYDYFTLTSFYFILSQSVVLYWSKPSIFKVRLHYSFTLGGVGLFQLGHIICIFSSFFQFHRSFEGKKKKQNTTHAWAQVFCSCWRYSFLCFLLFQCII